MVRHADDHVHIVAVLARQDGEPLDLKNDYFQVRDACLLVERRVGLRATSPADQTAPKATSRPEWDRAQDTGTEAPRARLRTLAREVAAQSASTAEFFARLRLTNGMVVSVRSSRGGAAPTGYSVGLKADHDPTGRVQMFSGGSLAADLSLPKLQQRWATSPTRPRPRRRATRPPG